VRSANMRTRSHDKVEASNKPAVESKKVKQQAHEGDAASETSTGVGGRHFMRIQDNVRGKIVDVMPFVGYPSFLSGAKVVGDYSVTLNKSSVSPNTNKFYMSQVVEANNKYFVLHRWGRIGKSTANSFRKFGSDVVKAVHDFEKTFKDKTGNEWGNRANFVEKSGMYCLVETTEDTTAASVRSISAKPECILDKNTFDSTKRGFVRAVETCPLGHLSQHQVDKGLAVLKDIESLLDNETMKRVGGKLPSEERAKRLTEMSNHFYTIIPHDVGRHHLHVIADKDSLHAAR